MTYKLITFLLCCATVFTFSPVFSQNQTCPININFATGDLSLWSAKTGLVGGVNQNFPAPNNGVSVIPEYTITPTGIEVITVPTTDLYGGFTTIPVINGYSYNYAVKIGS